jgi:hypothetical protein
MSLVPSTIACDTPMPPTDVSYALLRPGRAAVPVSGRTVDYGTNTAVSNVAVAFGNFDFSGRFVARAMTVSDAAGAYTLTIEPGTYLTRVGDGSGSIQVMRAISRGDFLVNSGTCVSRYGTIADLLTGRPVAGARITLAGKTVNSEADGWYRLDLGCPANGLIGFNTTFMYISHPDYIDKCEVAGRGVGGVARVDVSLSRRTATRPCSAG